ncbi:hypothetical protein CRENPOLYSF2_2620003 [Crenothrix polyspora]|uniref:Uncharacterized protein n=1 Tax=Crenothrix polyspora TaxID=360316 RepID=A0A1R4H8D4_9GAMM|nr:hypothetical protein CRENPOLYSF2_2620003 [Crenothrix polyspora]
MVGVVGSSPIAPTKKIKALHENVGLFMPVEIFCFRSSVLFPS